MNDTTKNKLRRLIAVHTNAVIHWAELTEERRMAADMEDDLKVEAVDRSLLLAYSAKETAEADLLHFIDSL